MVKITCPHCAFEKWCDCLPTHASYAKCPKCQNYFSLSPAPDVLPPKEAKKLEPAFQEKLSESLTLQVCSMCKTPISTSDARCFACGTVIDFGLPKGRGGGELTVTRLFLGSICIGLAVVVLCTALTATSWVSNKGFRWVSHSEGAEILLFLGIAWIIVIFLALVGLKLFKTTPVKRT